MNAEERELLDCFSLGTCESFSHEQHVHVAWLLLNQHALADAIELFSEGARALAASRGRPEIYHETLTRAYLHEIHQRVTLHPGGAWKAFVDRNPELFEPGNAIIKRRYRQETWDSDLARREYVLPDRR